MSSPKMMIVIRHDLKMRKGKTAAQAGHACVDAVLSALAREDRLRDLSWKEGTLFFDEGGRSSALSEWLAGGCAKVCVYVNSEDELLEINRKAQEAGLITSLIRDAGLTEFHGEPTLTCLAVEPAYPETVDPVTGELPLY